MDFLRLANQIRMASEATTTGVAMARRYSGDLRVPALAIVEASESAREAARLLTIGASTAIRWIERWTTTGSVDGHRPQPLAPREARAVVARSSRKRTGRDA